MSSEAGRVDAITPARALLVVALIYATFTAVTVLLAQWAGSPFVPWFHDTALLLAALLGTLLLLGIVWDGSLVLLGLSAQSLRRALRRDNLGGLSVPGVRGIRFFTCGPAPIAMLLATALAILGTSNITLLSLELLVDTTRWRDPLLWELEGALLERLAGAGISVGAWDKLYHSAWGIEVVAAFALIVVGRGPRIILHYCVSMIILFYIGRLLGVINPVMGPAFFRPDLFAYLEGSASAEAMSLVSGILHASPNQALASGGVLLGGVSAMPSLHVAMVAVTAYWLARASRWTIPFTVPWVLLVWTSTVVLGWHYIVDGAGGIALGAICVWLTTRLLNGRLSGIPAAVARQGAHECAGTVVQRDAARCRDA